MSDINGYGIKKNDYATIMWIAINICLMILTIVLIASIGLGFIIR